MRLPLLLVVGLLATPLVGCLGGGEPLEETNTSTASPPSEAPSNRTEANTSDEEAPQDPGPPPAETDARGNKTPDETSSKAPRPPATSVVAHIDTGINPYHEAFRDDSELAHTHPSEYIDGFPEDAQALNLTLDADSYEQALEADQDVWANVTEGEIYWVPGTRIVGAISFDEGGTREGREELPILDDHGHGTMTASRAVGEGTSLAPDARLVTVEGIGGQQVEWVAEQPWIDVQTNSWVDRVPSPANQFQDEVPEVGLASTSQAFATAADRMVTIAASGNGAAYTAGGAPMPTYGQPTAPDGVIVVGAHDNGYLTPWSGSPPHLIADGFRPLAAVVDSTTAIEPHGYACCTSASAPYAAGAAASLIAQARAQLDDRTVGIEDGIIAEGQAPVDSGPLADGEFTRTELREVLFATAHQRPVATLHDGGSHWASQPSERQPDDPTNPGENPYCPGCWTSPITYEDIPPEAPAYVYTGYGAVNVISDQRAQAVLLGFEEMPDRERADRFYEADQTVRETYSP